MSPKLARFLTSLVFCSLASGAAVSAQETKWTAVKPAGAEFTAEFPGKPTREARVLPPDNAVLSANVHDLLIYDLVADNIRYQIMSFGKAFAAPDKFEGTLDSFANAFERASLGTNPSEKKSVILAQVHPENVRQYQLQLGDYRGVLRLYEAKYHFYAVMTVHAASSGGSETERFLNAFKVTSFNKQQFDKDLSDVVQPPVPPELWTNNLAVSSEPVKGGLMNGKAIEFPVPRYPDEARRIGASGQVTVQVTIDEDGKVISATAIRGPDVFYEVATKAALKARFSKTRINGQAVKVVGVLIYNFVYGR